MKHIFRLLCAIGLIGCAGVAPPSHRPQAATDVPENHPHPPATWVPTHDGSPDLMRCWPNGEDTVCRRDHAD